MVGALHDFLKPRVRRAMPRERVIAVNEAVADATVMKARKKMRKADAAAAAAPPPPPPEPFDYRGRAEFCRSWDSELDTMDEDELDRFLEKINPHFCGQGSPEQWRAILDFLRTLRASLRQPAPVTQRTNRHAFGYWGSFEGF
jgi:hypothetical protein